MDSKALLDNLDVGVAVIAPDWTIGYWSPAAARLTGRPADRVLGKTFWTAFPTAKATHVERVLQDVLHDGEPRTYLAPAQALGSTGTFFETRVTRGPQNQLILLLRDVHTELPSESRAAQILTAFEEERRLYAQLFSLLPIPRLVLSVDGQILDANPEAGALLGAPDIHRLRGGRLGDPAPAGQRPAPAAGPPGGGTTRQRLRVALDFGGQAARDEGPAIEKPAPPRPAP